MEETTPTIILPKYVHKEFSRHGKPVWYYRRNGRRIRLISTPGSQDFFNEIAAISERNEILFAPPGELVYFIRYGRRVKIGRSRDVSKRHTDIKNGLPGKSSTILYVTPGGTTLEKELHRKFTEYRVNGEWFIYSKAIRNWIEADKERRFEKHAAA